MGYDADLGQRVHCRDLSSGRYFTGTLLITEKEITADLFAYGERYIHVDASEPVHLQTQNLNVVSLHSNVAASSGTAFRQSDDPRLRNLYHIKISSYVAVIGPSPWLGTDEVKSAYFEIADATFVLRNSKKMDRIASSEFASEVDRNLFSVTVDGLTIRADYGASYLISQPYPTKLFTSLAISFDHSRTLRSYLKEVLAVVQLFAASAGIPLTPKELQISRRTVDENLSDREDRHSDPHLVKYLWPEVASDKTLVWAGSSFLLSTDDVELESLKTCLVAWMERRHEWEKANTLMMASLMLGGEISPNRFLNACRWFEEIPLTKAEQAISDEDIDSITDVASAKAIELGYSKISRRVSGALKLITVETQKNRFLRLLQSIRKRFGNGAFEDEIIEDLMRATAFRGKAAHGHIGAETEGEHILFVRSLFAMEAFCFLLTVRDLPMNAKSAKRAPGNPLVQNYRHAPSSPVSVS